MATETRTPTALDVLAEEWVEVLLEHEPEWHVELGRPGGEGRYTDHSPDGHAARSEAARVMRRRVETTPVADEVDRVTRAELLRVLTLDIEMFEAGLWRHDLNVIASPVQVVRGVFDSMPTASEHDWAAVATRLTHVPSALAGYTASLRSGMATGAVPARRQAVEVAVQAERTSRQDGFFAGLVETARGRGLPGSLIAELASGADGAAAAYARLAAFLRDDLAPRGRTTDAVGREVYALCSRRFVGVEIDLDETYAWGVDELARMVAEQEAVAREIVPGGGVAEAVARLDADPALRAHGTEALRDWMQQVSDRAVADLAGHHFDVPEPLRRLECRIAPTREGGIYYTPPSEDFTRPGRMWWSVPEGVEDFSLWRELTTVYHEGVPGHHLQVGTAVALHDELNSWRRGVNWNSGHGEGWALYAERLMDDLGHLDSPAARLGMLDGQRMRAARVVVDLGVHLGKPRPDGPGAWTGDHAFAFMPRHVSMNAPFVRFEVLRYLGWPGQAACYKVGQRLWEDLRDDARAAAGASWDIRDFHRRALSHGSIGLGTLRDTMLG